jgi:hypothetical protein
MCPPRRNNSPPFAAHHIDHYDFNVFHKTDREYAVFTTTAVNSLEHGPSNTRLASLKSMWCFARFACLLLSSHSKSIPAP